MQKNQVAIVAPTVKDLSNSAIEKELGRFKIFTSADKLFRYKYKFSFVLKRFIVRSNVAAIQSKLNEAWINKVGQNNVFFVKQEEVINDNGNILYQSAYFVENTQTNEVLDSLVWGNLDQASIKNALDIQVQNSQDKYKDYFTNSTDHIRWKDAFSFVTIRRISKLFYDDINRTLVNMWREIRNLNVEINIFEISEKYVQESGSIVYKLFYKVKRNNQLLKASNLNNFDYKQNLDNFDGVIVLNNQKLSTLVRYQFVFLTFN